MHKVYRRSCFFSEAIYFPDFCNLFRLERLKLGTEKINKDETRCLPLRPTLVSYLIFRVILCMACHGHWTIMMIESLFNLCLLLSSRSGFLNTYTANKKTSLPIYILESRTSEWLSIHWLKMRSALTRLEANCAFFGWEQWLEEAAGDRKR